MRHFCSSLRIERFRVNAVGCGVEGFLCVENFVQIKKSYGFQRFRRAKILIRLARKDHLSALKIVFQAVLWVKNRPMENKKKKFFSYIYIIMWGNSGRKKIFRFVLNLFIYSASNKQKTTKQDN